MHSRFHLTHIIASCMDILFDFQKKKLELKLKFKKRKLAAYLISRYVININERIVYADYHLYLSQFLVPTRQVARIQHIYLSIHLNS